MFSICIPTYNNISYLKILLKSHRYITKIPHEIIIVDNGSIDGTCDFLKEANIKYISLSENRGFCAVNLAIKESKFPYVAIWNSDMVALPGWDIAIMNQIQQFKKNKIDRFTISSCLIEPLGHNPEYDIFYCGHTAESFEEQRLLNWFAATRPVRQNTIQYSHPILIPKFMLEEVNYLDEQYFPGWSVDHDLPKSLYEKGCRNFIMLGNSRVFHFISKTFTKLPDNVRNKDGQDIFFKKWGMSVQEFRNKLEIATPFKEVK